MQTNVSRHTCTFSDHPWQTGRAFPTTREMGAYIESYTRAFLDPSMISLGHRVSRAEPNETGKWEIAWMDDATSEQGSGTFDNLIISSGVFCKPLMPDIPGLSQFPGKVLHSADLHNLGIVHGKRVAIIGDSFSAVELAGELAPLTTSLIHIYPRPFWVLPRIFPTDPAKPDSAFAPWDIVLCRRSLHKDEGETVFRTDDARREKNTYLASVLGDQGVFSEGLRVAEDQESFVATSDSYINSVRNGTIKSVLGRLTDISGTSLVLEDGRQLDDGVDIIIMATGFSAAMPFFSDEILQELAFESRTLRHPLLLHRSVFHPSPKLRNAAFVGLYRGPYMGVIELHAKWAARVLSGQHPRPSEDEQRAGIAFEQTIRDADPPIQFPHGDYVGLMKDLARELGIDPTTAWKGRDIDVICAAQFSQGDLPSRIIGDLDADIAAATKGKWVSAAIFNALQGDWQLHRKIQSFSSNYPSGAFIGAASFIRTPIQPYDPSAAQDVRYEYKYLERGKLVTDEGLELDAHRRYRYQYDDAEDRIDVYFDDSSGEGHFHGVRILTPEEIPDIKYGYNGEWEPWVGENIKGWRAIGDHWCAPVCL